MVEEVESLVLEASVVDDFSKTLDELSGRLAGIATQEEQVDPIKIDTAIATTLAELEAVDQKLRQIDRRDVDVNIDTDRDIPAMWARDLGAIPGTPDYDLLDRQIEKDGLNVRGDHDRIGRMSNIVDARTPVLSLPETDIIPDLDEWRRRSHDRGPIQNIRDAVQDFTNLRLSMGILMNMLAAFVPLFGVFVGALPSAIAGLGGLAAAAIAAAGAMAAVGGLALGAMLFEDGELNVAEAQRHMRDLLDTFIEAFGPIMEALRPVAEAIFRNADMVIRDLAVSARGLLQLSDDFIAAFEWLSSTLQGATAEAIAFADAAMPVLSFIISGMTSTDWLGIFAMVIADTLPLLVEFTGIMMVILAGLYDLSLGFFQVANAVLGVMSLFFGLINAVPLLGKVLGTLISIMLVAVTVSSLYSLALTTTMQRIIGLATAIYANTVGALYSYIAAQYGAAAATLATAAAVGILLGVVTFGLAPAITAITSQLTGVNAQVGSAADEMRRFAHQSRRARIPNMSTAGAGGMGAPGYSAPSGGNTIIAPDKETGNAVSNTIRFNENQSSTTTPGDVENRQHSGGG